MASGSFTSVNLSQLPAPAVIEVLDFEAMFDESLTALQALDPTFDALLPSDPAFKILRSAPTCACSIASVSTTPRVA